MENEFRTPWYEKYGAKAPEPKGRNTKVTRPLKLHDTKISGISINWCDRFNSEVPWKMLMDRPRVTIENWLKTALGTDFVMESVKAVFNYKKRLARKGGTWSSLLRY